MNTPLEDQVHDALHRRVDPLQRTPFTVTDVQQRARRIQRRRTMAAGAAVAAVVAVAVPLALGMNGPAQRSDVPPATRTPQITGPVRIDPRSAPVGDAPQVPLVDTTGPTLIVGEESFDLPRAYDQITPYRDGWIALITVDGVGMLDVLDQSFDRLDFETRDSDLTVSPDGSRVTWASYDGQHWSIPNNDVAGGEPERPWTTLPDGPYESAVGTVGFVSADEVLAYQLDQVDGTITTFLADGKDIVELPAIDQPESASPATGMIAARTFVDDGSSCGATFDGRSRSPEPLWTDCERSLGDFNAAGSLLFAFPSGDQVTDGDPPGVSVLDAATGESVVDFEVTRARDRGVGIADVVWEDDQTLLATYVDGNQQYVVRLGLNGTVERVAGPVTNDDFTLSLRLTPGTLR